MRLRRGLRQNTIVREDCSRETCAGGLTCTAEGASVASTRPAPRPAARPLRQDGVLVCENGSATAHGLRRGRGLLAGACVSAVCGETDGDVCVDGSTVARCVGGAHRDACAISAAWRAPVSPPAGDASVGDSDAGVPSGESDGFRPVPTSAKGGCSATGDSRVGSRRCSCWASSRVVHRRRV
ncbi:MAG: hypothetical protein R3B99_06570 [Polyangiales bacterium]